MKINTSFFGELQVEESEIITFTQGIPGFEEEKQYVMLHLEEGSPFSYIQSIHEKELSFLVTDPFLFFKDYDFTLPEAVQEELKIIEPEDVQVWSVVTVNEDFTKITTNLLAPILINVKAKLAKQIILHDSAYHVKHELVISDLSSMAQVEG